MVKLFQLIRRFWNIILFFIFEAIAFSLIAKSRNIQGEDIASSSNAVVGFLYQKQNEFVNYFQLRNINDSLLKENNRLQNELTEFKYIDTLQDIYRKIPLLAYDTTYMAPDTSGKLVPTANSEYSKPVTTPRVVRYAEYKYTSALVINNSVSNDRNNFITINVGSNDGIKRDMAVVSSSGIVGRVVGVSKHYATVISVLSSRSISSQIANGNVGVVNWTTGNPDYVVMSQVPLQANPKKGDIAYTTSYSVYPENISIGTVTEIDTYKVNNSLNLKLKLSSNFRNLKYVYVVTNKMKDEPDALQKETIEKDKAANSTTFKPKP